jgi:hypothetical protein
MFCAKCGEELAAGDSFCRSCGTRVGLASAAFALPLPVLVVNDRDGDDPAAGPVRRNSRTRDLDAGDACAGSGSG